MAPKCQNDPKIKSKSNDRIEGNIENESCSTIWVDPKTVIEPYSDPKNSPLGPQKVKNDPKIKSKSKSKVRIEGTIENKSFSTTWVDPKIVFQPNFDPEISPLGPQKVKKTPKKSPLGPQKVKNDPKIK